MSSWQCIVRYNVIDTIWFPVAYLFVMIVLFAHKKRLISTIFVLLLIPLISASIGGCLGSIGALTGIAVPNWIIIVYSYVVLFIMSFFDYGGIYKTCGIYVLGLVISLVCLLLIAILSPKPTG
jgi:hypothetical protein